MMDVSRMSASEAMAEGVRRADRRKQGLPLEETPAEAVERLAEEDNRLEKDIQREVVKLYRAHRCVVYELSQKRASKQTPGIADLYVMYPEMSGEGPLAFWHEVKTPTGRLRPDQNVFGEHCQQCGVFYVVGGVAAAEIQLKRIGAWHE